MNGEFQNNYQGDKNVSRGPSDFLFRRSDDKGGEKQGVE